MIGVIIAEAGALRRIERLIEPVRDMFSAIFFVAIGLMLDPHVLLDYAGPIAAATAGGDRRQGAGAHAPVRSPPARDGDTSMRVGMSLAQIGEFSFIIATLGTTLKVTSAFPLSDRGRGVGDHDLVHAVPDPRAPIRWRAASRTAHAAGISPHPAHVHGVAAEPALRRRPRGDCGDGAHASCCRRSSTVAWSRRSSAPAPISPGATATEIAHWLPNPQIANAVIWGAALVLSLPFLIAAYRKLKALAMMLAEVGVRAGRHTERVQRIVAEVLPAVSIAAMLLLGLRAVVEHPAAGGTARRGAGDGRTDPDPALAHAGQAAFAPADRAARDVAVGKGQPLARRTERAPRCGSARIRAAAIHAHR